MNKRTGLVFAAWAIGGFGLTLAFVSPGRLDATSPDSAPQLGASLSPTPINGVEMVLATPGQFFTGAPILLQANAQPKIELRVKNTTPQSADVEADISVNIQQGSNPFSRVPFSSRPVVWTKHQSLSLAPMESRTITLDAPQEKLQPGGRIVASLASGGQSIQPLELYVQQISPAQRRAILRGPTTGTRQ
jgi:hypothetical protein